MQKGCIKCLQGVLCLFYRQTRKGSIGHGKVKVGFYVTSLTITKPPKWPASTQSRTTSASSTTLATKRKVNFLIYLLFYHYLINVRFTWQHKKFSDYKSFGSLIFLRANVKWLNADPDLSFFCFDSTVWKKFLSYKRLLKFSWRHYLLLLSKGRKQIRRSAVVTLNKKHYLDLLCIREKYPSYTVTSLENLYLWWKAQLSFVYMGLIYLLFIIYEVQK